MVKICAVKFRSGDFRFACLRDARHPNMVEGEIVLPLRSICQKRSQTNKVVESYNYPLKMIKRFPHEIRCVPRHVLTCCFDQHDSTNFKSDVGALPQKIIYFFRSSFSELFSESMHQSNFTTSTLERSTK